MPNSFIFPGPNHSHRNFPEPFGLSSGLGRFSIDSERMQPRCQQNYPLIGCPTVFRSCARWWDALLCATSRRPVVNEASHFCTHAYRQFGLVRWCRPPIPGMPQRHLRNAVHQISPAAECPGFGDSPVQQMPSSSSRLHYLWSESRTTLARVQSPISDRSSRGKDDGHWPVPNYSASSPTSRAEKGTIASSQCQWLSSRFRQIRCV